MKVNPGLIETMMLVGDKGIIYQPHLLIFPPKVINLLTT